MTLSSRPLLNTDLHQPISPPSVPVPKRALSLCFTPRPSSPVSHPVADSLPPPAPFTTLSRTSIPHHNHGFISPPKSALVSNTAPSSSCSITAAQDTCFSKCMATSSLPSSIPPFSLGHPPPIVHSPFRPPVAAHMHILAWSSPYAESVRKRDLATLPPALLASFIVSCSGSYSGSTVKAWLSGLNAWHIINQASWSGDDGHVSLARSSASSKGSLFKCSPCAPVSVEHLYVLRSSLNLSSPFNTAIWATAAVTFFGCYRLGETTVSSSQPFFSSLHCSSSTLVTFRTLPLGSSASFCIPWTKTTCSGGASVVVMSRDDDLCPVAALRNHLAVNTGAPPLVSLFGY